MYCYASSHTGAFASTDASSINNTYSSAHTTTNVCSDATNCSTDTISDAFPYHRAVMFPE